MELINYLENKYPFEKGYVFKPCEKNWIIILKKLEKNGQVFRKKLNYDIACIINQYAYKTKTNELRYDIVNSRYSRFCADQLFVIDIINKFNLKYTVNQITTSAYYNKLITYKTGETVDITNLNDSFDKLCTSGIYYLINPESAFYYEIPDNYTGLYKKWHNNGQLHIECIFNNEKLDGPYKIWHENGQLKKQCTYKNGKYDGIFQQWYWGGKRYIDCVYKNGKKDGKYKTWYWNGHPDIECTYKDDELHDLYKEWRFDGQLKEEYTYINGECI
jgi:antitoxin component YwqK of YwqJK toxin-antitoxin module